MPRGVVPLIPFITISFTTCTFIIIAIKFNVIRLLVAPRGDLRYSFVKKRRERALYDHSGTSHGGMIVVGPPQFLRFVTGWTFDRQVADVGSATPRGPPASGGTTVGGAVESVRVQGNKLMHLKLSIPVVAIPPRLLLQQAVRSYPVAL